MIEEASVRHPWYISIWGQGALDDTSILRRAIELGGHIKTGLELFHDPARNPTNLELLPQAQEIAREVGRPIATQAEARAMYQISRPLRRLPDSARHGLLPRPAPGRTGGWR